MTIKQANIGSTFMITDLINPPTSNYPIPTTHDRNTDRHNHTNRKFTPIIATQLQRRYVEKKLIEKRDPTYTKHIPITKTRIINAL